MVHLKNEYALICKEFMISDEQRELNNITSSPPDSSLDSDTITRCVCDFRINFSGCEEENLLRTLHWILVPYCVLIIMIAIGFLYYRIYILKLSFWLTSTRERGILRPRPQEIIHSSTIIFNLFHVIHILIVLFNAYPNYTLAEIGQGLSRELFIGLALIYPISLVYTTPTNESKNSITSSNSRSPPNRHIVDIIGFILLLAPISTLFPLTWVAGHYVDINKIKEATSICRIYNLIWVVWVTIFLISLIYYWCKLIIMIWDHIKELKRKEVSGTSDMQWTVSTLRRAARNLCLAISSLVIIIATFLVMSFSYGFFHKQYTTFNFNVNIMYVIVWNFTIPVISNLVQFFFLYKTIKPKTQKPSSSIESKFTTTNTSKKDERRKREDSLRDDESLIGGTTTTTPLTTPLASPMAFSTPQITTTTVPAATTNHNSNSDYFVNPNPNVLNAAAINDILQNKTSIELNRNEAYQRLNSTRPLSRSNSQNLAPIIVTTSSDADDGIYPSFLSPRNDYYNRNSLKRPLFIFSDEKNSNEIDSTYNVNRTISNGKRVSTESIGLRRISKSSITNSSIGIMNTNSNDTLSSLSNLSIRRISNQIKHQKSFESSMDLIAEENSDGQRHHTTITKRNRSSVSVSREASDTTSTTVVTTSTTYSSSTTVSTTTTLVSPAAAAAAKASWDKPDDDDRLSSIDRNSIESMEKREWLSKRPVSPIPRRKTLTRLSTI